MFDTLYYTENFHCVGFHVFKNKQLVSYRSEKSIILNCSVVFLVLF